LSARHWLTREQLGTGTAVGAGAAGAAGAADAVVGGGAAGAVASPRNARGLLLVSPDAATVVPLPSREQVIDLAARALAMAGIGAGDRIVIALSNDGELTGALLAEAGTGVAQAAASTGPRGRLRLHAALKAIGATALVITPTGAMDFLARLHLEFLLDPLDLELSRIVVTGEIASPGTGAHLSAEFGAQVTELYAEPVTGTPVAAVDAGGLRPVRDGLIALAALDKDHLLDPPYPAGLAEIVLTPPWLGGALVLRTGHVARIPGGPGRRGPGCPRGAECPPGSAEPVDGTRELIPVPRHTVGDHICVRGRWLPLGQLAAALARIDGISGWELRVSREGTLDSATLNVTFGRETLIGNPMWKARIEQALVAITPVRVDVVISDRASEEAFAPVVTDLRGQHLGVDRASL
jgi:hypothetical protein